MANQEPKRRYGPKPRPKEKLKLRRWIFADEEEWALTEFFVEVVIRGTRYQPGTILERAESAIPKFVQEYAEKIKGTM